MIGHCYSVAVHLFSNNRQGVGPTQVVLLIGRVKFMEVSKTVEYARFFCTSRTVEKNYKSVGRKDSPSVYLLYLFP